LTSMGLRRREAFRAKLESFFLRTELFLDNFG
jgi:hypothetical protein